MRLTRDRTQARCVGRRVPKYVIFLTMVMVSHVYTDVSKLINVHILNMCSLLYVSVSCSVVSDSLQSHRL